MTRFLKQTLAASAVAIAALSATPASAALTLVGPGCSAATPAPDAIACRGAYSGNLNSNARIGDLNAALDLLVGGYSPDVTWAPLDATKAFFTAGAGTTVNFGGTLFGQNIISMHFGDAGSGLGDTTILYLFDFGVAGATSVDVGQRGWSNAVLIRPPVPEPGTWAMMLLGFGATGFALRRSRRRNAIAQIA